MDLDHDNDEGAELASQPIQVRFVRLRVLAIQSPHPLPFASFNNDVARRYLILLCIKVLCIKVLCIKVLCINLHRSNDNEDATPASNVVVVHFITFTVAPN